MLTRLSRTAQKRPILGGEGVGGREAVVRVPDPSTVIVKSECR